MSSSPQNVPGNLIVSPLFVPLAVEAGIDYTIKTVVNGSPMELVDLVIALRSALWDVNRPLAEGINQASLTAILDYYAQTGEVVAIATNRLPSMIDQDGPGESFWVGYTNPILTCTWAEPPEGWDSLIAVDNIPLKLSKARSEGDGTSDDSLSIALGTGTHTVRVCYRRQIDGALSRLSVIREIMVG